MTTPAVVETPVAKPETPAPSAINLNDPDSKYDVDITPPEEPEESEEEDGEDGEEGEGAGEGETPEVPATPETPTEPEKPANVDEEALYRKFQERQTQEAARAKAQADFDQAQSELAALGPATKQAVTDTLQALGEKYGVNFTFADVQALISPVEKLAEKGLAAARLELGQQGTAAATQAVREYASNIEDAFYDALPASLHKAFTDAVQGKPISGWVDALHEIAPSSAKQLASQASALATAATAEFPSDSDFAKEFSTATAKAKNPGDVVKALFSVARKLGFSDPITEPVGTEGKSLGPKRTFAELQRGYGDGSNTPAQDAEYLRQDAERKK